MRILALETATSLGSIAVLEDGMVVADLSAFVPRRHLEWLVPAVHELLSSAGWTPRHVQAVAVSTGPGSFTSLRIGIATASAWARAMGIPAVGVSTLATLAAGTEANGLVCPILDVRRGEVAAALFTQNGISRRVTEDVVGSIPSILLHLPPGPITFCGDALARQSQVVTGARPDAVLAPPARWYPTAAWVGRLGWERLARGEHTELYRLWPTYVRAPTNQA